jgi:hypothetical protein
MSDKESIDRSGTPRTRYVYAVFDNRDASRDAYTELLSIGIHAEQLDGTDAPSLEHSGEKAGVVGKIDRFLKGLGGESNMATRYAKLLRDGHVVLAAPVPSNELAAAFTHIAASHDGYEVTYFRDWGIQYMSPSENIKHGLPIHSETNTDTTDG